MLVKEKALRSWKDAHLLASKYRKDESGSLIAFSLFIFFVMIMFGGIAVDLMIYENKRTHIQNSTDRAVLAAANLNQTVDPRTVVKDYLAKVGIIVTDDDIDVFEVGAAPVITGRQVSVTVSSVYNTLLLKLSGVPTLTYGAMSEAEESVNDVEVSLILDISGSMGSNSKLGNMQTAAKDFVSKILAGADDNRVSLSLVPYSTQVSIGSDLMALMNRQYDHNFSYCVNFASDDFDTTAIDHTVALDRTAHFDPWAGYSNSWGQALTYEVCRSEPASQVRAWSNNVTALNNQIDALTASGNTSIDVAMKWGTALLDPSMRTQLNGLITNPSVEVDVEFAPRPHDYTYPDALKFVVLMTDGINTNQPYLLPAWKTGNSPYYQRHSNNDIYWKNTEPSDRDGDGRWNEPWYNVSDRNWTRDPFGRGNWNDDVERLNSHQMSWLELWSEMTMAWRAYGHYHNISPYNANVYYDNLYQPRRWVNASSKDSRLSSICTAAKAQGIVVFAVGFEVTDHSADVMRDCASTPNHFYRVEGLDIEYAFASIANQINQLKLTQ